MSDADQTHTIDLDRILNQVGDPEAFIRDLRLARQERQLRRNQFIDSVAPDVKAEWIEGEAVFHSPARESHNATVYGLTQLLGPYDTYVRRIRVRVEKAMVKAGDNNFEPDVCVWFDGASELDPATMVYPRPDLAVEVLSPRTADRDLGVKKREYARAGTAEYWVLDALEHRLRQFVNDAGRFREAQTFQVGDDFTSVALPDLRFPLDAIWDYDLRAEVGEGWVLARRARRQQAS